MGRPRGPRPDDTLYHGTNTEVSTVLPPSKSGARMPNSDLVMGRRSGTPHDPREHASATTKEAAAWEFAGMTAQRAGGRAAVLKVDPAPDMKRGLEPKEHLSAQGFPVRGVENIRPPESKRVPNTFMKYAPNPNGRQGTLPVDWTPPAKHGIRYMSMYEAQHGDQYNHPTQRHREDEAKRIAGADKQRDADEVLASQQFRGGPKASQPMLPGMRGAVKRQPKRKATP